MTVPIEYMGLNLKNPVVIAAGPWSRDSASIQQSIDSGAAAVVTETITLESSNIIYPRIYAQDGQLLNTTLYSPLSFEAWENELQRIEKRDSFVICNIRGSTPSELTYIATRMERWGADGLELCPFTPIGVKLESASTKPDEVREMLTSVLESVSIPVSIRLPNYLACSKDYVKEVEKSGAYAISIIETMKALWGVDIENRISRVPTFGGYSGIHIFPITLAATATLSQLTNCQISSMGGIRDYHNILECIMLGATTVQLGSTVLLQGYQVIEKIVNQLSLWMEEHALENYDDIRGCALSSLKTYEDIEPQPMISKPRNIEFISEEMEMQLVNCQIACLKKAISIDDKSRPHVNLDRCDGCGLCVTLAPKIFYLKTL